jgi:hypothetical protein
MKNRFIMLPSLLKEVEDEYKSQNGQLDIQPIFYGMGRYGR